MGVSYKRMSKAKHNRSLTRSIETSEKYNKVKVLPCFSFLDVIHVNEHSGSEETTTPSNQIGTF